MNDNQPQADQHRKCPNCAMPGCCATYFSGYILYGCGTTAWPEEEDKFHPSAACERIRQLQNELDKRNEVIRAASELLEGKQIRPGPPGAGYAMGHPTKTMMGHRYA